jgi:hypothetical protein
MGRFWRIPDNALIANHVRFPLQSRLAIGVSAESSDTQDVPKGRGLCLDTGLVARRAYAVLSRGP